MGKNSRSKTVIDSITGLVKAVPVYRDTMQPAAKELGKAFETVAKAINAALAPVGALVWGYEKLRDYLLEALNERLAEVPASQIISPSPVIAGPVLEALRYAGSVDELREMYAALLANSMNSATVQWTHPGFVEIIRNLSSDDARIFRQFAAKESYPVIDIRACLPKKEGYKYRYRLWVRNWSKLGEIAGCDSPDKSCACIDNLCRLGLVEVCEGELDGSLYEGIIDTKDLEELKTEIEVEHKLEMKVIRKCVRRTNYGIDFLRACVIPPTTSRNK